MSVRARVVSFAAVSIWLAAPTPVRAHRLDEYLQATRLSIEADRVGLEVNLTAGVDMASEVFAWIDTNRDGQISSDEGEAYARQVLGSVVLSVDGRTTPVTLVDFRFPRFDDMSRGVGTIQLRATAELSSSGAGRHRVSFVNTHRPERSIYLVNALVPSDSRIQIGGQQRDRAQHGLTLDYTVAGGAQWARTWSLLAALGMSGVLGMTRRPRRQPQA
jgi:hypothetical protein